MFGTPTSYLYLGGVESVKRKLKCPEKISLVQVCDTS